MARVKITEYRAKSLLVPEYDGVTLRIGSLDNDCKKLSKQTPYVVKVDQGIKKRGKQGLVKLNVAATDVKKAVKELSKRGFERFVAEPMVSHDANDEVYVSIERTRDGVVILYSPNGGVDIEEHPESIAKYTQVFEVPLPSEFLNHVIAVMDKEHLSFVEINPLVLMGDGVKLLDAAVLADSTGDYISTWSNDDIVTSKSLSGSEEAVAVLNDNSPASFSFRVLNPDGALWLLLSRGGASITIADEAHNQQKASLIGNYGEYSGGPSSAETYLYTTEVLKQMQMSKAKKKALVIAGGVANFTDVKKTFIGVIKAMREYIDTYGAMGLRVFVRRGGPNEAEGLEMMEKFLRENNILGSVHGSDIVLTEVVNEALAYVGN